MVVIGLTIKTLYFEAQIKKQAQQLHNQELWLANTKARIDLVIYASSKLCTYEFYEKFGDNFFCAGEVAIEPIHVAEALLMIQEEHGDLSKELLDKVKQNK